MKLSPLCILTTIIFPTVALANPVDVSLCSQTELNNSFPVDGTSERIKPFTGKGQQIIFKLPNDFNASSEVDITETKRQSRLEEEITKIIKQTVKIAGTATPNCIYYAQENERAKISVTIKNGDASSKKTFIAGPLEHWYLSADMPVTKVKQLTYDAASGKYAEKDVPQSFYLGINYKLGDVYLTPDYTDNFYENLSLKLLFKVAAPSESYGVGLGYDFGPAVVFAARIKTVNDASAASAPSSRSLATVYGISFDIEKGLSWLSGK